MATLQSTERFMDVGPPVSKLINCGKKHPTANVITVRLTQQPVWLLQLICMTATLWRHLQPRPHLPLLPLLSPRHRGT